MRRWRAEMTATGQERNHRLPPITTHAIECLLMDKCTPCQRALQHPTGYSSLSKCGDRCIDESHHRADILITWTTRSSVRYRETDGLWACSLWKTGLHFFFFLKCDGGTKANPSAGNQHPRSVDFQTNIMITIFWPFGVCCIRLWQSRQKEARE